MKRPQFNLKTIYSNGPKVLRVDDGSTYVKSTPCGRCGADIVEGDVIAKVQNRWQHEKCSTATLANVPASQAWLALAMDAARRPRDYKTAQLRQILEAVVDIAYGAEQEEHEAYLEALTFAYERKIEEIEEGHPVVVDPHDFASRYTEFAWPRPDWDERRLPVELAFIEAYRAALDQASGPRNWDTYRMATAAMGGPETPENRERAKAWVTELVTDALGPEGPATVLPKDGA